jgi:tetratricopeptide (TPR) repeat protein
VEALQYYDEQEYEKALELFEQNADTSKIYFNIGMIHATLGEHEQAVSLDHRFRHAAWNTRN